MPLIGMAGSTVLLLPVKDALQSAINLGFEAFEVFGEFPQCVCREIGLSARRELRSRIRDSRIAVAVHAPITSLNIAALNPGIREESVRQCLDAVDFCADLGGWTVIVHNGEFVSSEAVRAKIPEATRIQWDLNVSSLREIAKRGEERGITICLENIGFEPQFVDRCAEDMLRIRAEVDSPALAFCIDIGHARLNQELDEVIHKMGPDARHVHLADNLGEGDDHQIIGEGNVDYAPVLDFIRRFEHMVTLEVKQIGTDPAPAVRSRDYVRELLKLSLQGESHAG